MEHTPASLDSEALLAQFERQVEALIDTCKRLREENQSLRTQQEHLVGEKARLIEHTEAASSKVEAMVSRLKAMEQES